jgi:hypothetical protein
MVRWLGRVLTVFALCGAVGLHWVAIQSLAWTTMLVENSKHAPLSQAISRTFDGAHPCSLCHLVRTGKNSEKKSDLQATTKIDLLCTTRAFPLRPRFSNFDYLVHDFSFSKLEHSPPVPPPRSVINRV